MKVSDRICCEVERNKVTNNIFSVHTTWDFECYDQDGNLKWAELNRPNIVTHEGIDALLDIMFHTSTQIATWYVGITESDTPAAATMTYAVPVYTECTAYTESVRQEFVEAASSSQVITNTASKATFTINATKTLYGAFLVSNSTKADTAGAGAKLFCYSKFDASQSVVSTDSFKVTITITGAHA